MQVDGGPGWRLQVDPQRHPYGVLIGGAGWAAELSSAEALALQQGIGRLLSQHADLQDQLMPDEAITLELDLGGLWLALEGDSLSWQLRFVLTPGGAQRALEAGWDRGASQAFAAALGQVVIPG